MVRDPSTCSGPTPKGPTRICLGPDYPKNPSPAPPPPLPSPPPAPSTSPPPDHRLRLRRLRDAVRRARLWRSTGTRRLLLPGHGHAVPVVLPVAGSDLA
ncbi:hypothetical protein GUJ93_ZPchr0008g13857 [Zizania palustris]|uniref:Uncharacterized protein n=1 Tax=Zizania palustris TaxID=103762 RepID=A0A8J5RB29_ZIZPA|nr:hypothetical protein GUJ93_ZPchr0008g13857 [Zizania palustris]